jgi:predicted dehydrogenase
MTHEKTFGESNVSRRNFLKRSATAASAVSVVNLGIARSAHAAGSDVIKLGLVGCGQRGNWIAPLFQQHGGYEFHAVADYFQDRADSCGEALGVDANRRFSGLSGYKKVIDSGVDALVIITVPYCIAEMSAAGIDAGLHVYLAKPVAVDVPGCQSIGESCEKASQSQKVFLVDYQIPTDPNNGAVREALQQGKAGKLVRLQTVGINGGWEDPPKGENIENLLHSARWNNHIALSGGKNVSYDIHAIDAAVWLIGRRPLAAMGHSRIDRPNPQGDTADVASVIFEYEDGLIHQHTSQGTPNHTKGELSCKGYSYNSRAFIGYWQDALFQTRGVKPLGGPVEDLYAAGAKRNITDFAESIRQRDYGNETGVRSVDSHLTAILGREAAVRGVRLTMEELLRENTRIEPDLRGLKV